MRGLAARKEEARRSPVFHGSYTSRGRYFCFGPLFLLARRATLPDIEAPRLDSAQQGVFLV